jgi:hypothetical protein
MSRQGIPDYLVTMRKPGENPSREPHGEDFPVELWQNYASPVWMDINPSDTLQYREAREHDDERHICALQLQVIERGVKLWSNPATRCSARSPASARRQRGLRGAQDGAALPRRRS